MRWLNGTTGSMDISLSKFWKIVKDREDWHAEVKAPILWLPDVKSHLIRKTLMLGRIKSRRRSG